MNNWIEKFIEYNSQINTNSDHTKDAYKRDLYKFRDYLEQEGIQFNDVDREIILNYISVFRSTISITTSSSISSGLSTSIISSIIVFVYLA